MNINIQRFFQIFSNHFLKFGFLIGAIFIFMGMGDGGKPSTIKGPKYVELQKNNPSLHAQVNDGLNQIDVYDVSFGGSTKIGGLKRESISSVIELDLADVNELQILDPNFVSATYPDTEFILARAVFKNGTVIEDLLVPRFTQFSAKDLATRGGIKYAWDLMKVNKITLKHGEPLAPIKESQVTTK